MMITLLYPENPYRKPRKPETIDHKEKQGKQRSSPGRLHYKFPFGGGEFGTQPSHQFLSGSSLLGLRDAANLSPLPLAGEGPGERVSKIPLPRRGGRRRRTGWLMGNTKYHASRVKTPTTPPFGHPSKGGEFNHPALDYRQTAPLSRSRERGWGRGWVGQTCPI
jgi:hypothetical protein